MYISVAGRQAHSLSVNGLGLAKEFFTGHYAASNNKNLALELHESVVWKQVYELCLKPPYKSSSGVWGGGRRVRKLGPEQ